MSRGQQPIREVHDCACPNCWSTEHREREVDPKRKPLPHRCAEVMARRALEMLRRRAG